MSTLLALVMLGSCATGTIAVPGLVERMTITKLEERLNKLESTCVTQSAFNQRIAGLERRQSESKTEVDTGAQKTDQSDLNKLTKRYKEETKAAMTQNASVMHPLKESVNTDNPKVCQSGRFGNSFFPGIEKTWPRNYTLVFEPPFKYPPQFTFGIDYLDSHIVRVYSKVIELDQSKAKIEVGTWISKVLYGVTFRWMACP